MSRADTVTKLPIAEWFRLMGIHPLHGQQVYLEDFPPTVCGQPWIQHAWQAQDRIGREELALAIREAEDDIERELKSRLAPSWEVDEWRSTFRTVRPELTNLSLSEIRQKGQRANLRWMNLISGGIQAKELVSSGENIVYSDGDGDSYNEIATVTATVTFTDPCEVHICYPGKAGDDAWEIHPIDVDISTGTATITFRRELAVLEALQEAFDPEGVEGTNDSNFLTTVDVYRKYNDPQRQVQFLWEPFAQCSHCNGNGCEQCGYATQEGCLMTPEEPRLSIVSYHPASWNAATLEFDFADWSVGRQPDLIRVWYYAGIRDMRIPCSYMSMSHEWQRTVAYFAASKLDRPICECNNVGAFTAHWRRDLSVPGEEDMRISDDVLDNPFGTQRGAVYAWQRVKRSRDLPQEVAI